MAKSPEQQQRLSAALADARDRGTTYRSLCCEPACDRVAKVRGRCRRCHQRLERGTWPMRPQQYAGALCMDGCGRPARRVSGKCKACYLRDWNRERRRKYIFQRILGMELDLEALIRGANQLHPKTYEGAEAQRCFRQLLIEIKQGRLGFSRPPERP